jgi:monofunctional biosynthetic peptidoglycan transglycosylase
MAKSLRVRAARPARRSRLVGVLLALALLAALGAAALWLTLPDVRALAHAPPRTTAFIELRRATAAKEGRRFRLRWTWVAHDRVSRYLRFAVIAAEDARFYDHDGVDWDGVEQAARRDLAERRLSAGGSTITQQLAKNLYLSPSKNPLRKLREALIARALERALGKRRILELYLNVVEWGDGVFGAEAAARTYFGRSAGELTPAQAARLAVALPAPLHRSPRVRSDRLARKAGRLIDAMRWRGLIDDRERATARRELGL